MKFPFALMLVLTFCVNVTRSQNFLIVGDSYQIPIINNPNCLQAGNCFTLTDAINNQAGAVWGLDTIDLTHSFDATFCLTLGSNDAGADGFAFVMRGPGSDSIGGVGSGVGYADFDVSPVVEAITPSIAVEYDTYDNGPAASDIADDHTGLFFNGDNTTAIQPVVPLIGPGINAEDGNYHTTRIVWDASTDQFDMYFDGVMLISHVEDIVNTVFGGNPKVIWGFTASTGGAVNLQQICFPETQILLQDVSVCDEDTACFGFFTPGITNYDWTDEDGNVLTSWNSITSPGPLTDTTLCTTESGTFYLDITFNNNTFQDSLTVTFVDLPDVPFDEDSIEVCPDTQFPYALDALNSGDSYLWHNGETTQQINLTTEGLYSVEITEPILGCQSNDSIHVSFYCPPTVVLPNVFTPNGDLFNEIFEPIDYRWVGSSMINIYNRWGRIVYTDSNKVFWDGLFNGNEVSGGTYYYIMSFDDIKGENYTERKGFITLIR